MTFFNDLDICTYFPFECSKLLSIGWLSPSHEFSKGDVNGEFYDKLCELLKDPWEPVVTPGFHQCELCQFNGPAGQSNVFIPFGGNIYVAPELIKHYISAHWYKPPDIFVDAVMHCPKIRSMEYKKAILANGGREVVQAIST